MSDEAVPEFDRLAALEDRLLALETKGRWFVYELCYDDATSIAFYIGLTTDVERRVSEHRSNKASAAYCLCQDGFTYRVIKEFNNYPEALLFETMQIAFRSGLENRDIAECAAKLCLPDELWLMMNGWEAARTAVIRTLIPSVADAAAKRALKEAAGEALLEEALK